MKKVMSLVLVCLMLLSFAACNRAEKQPAGVSASITVEVVHSNGSKNVYSYVTDKPYLGDVLLESGLIQGDEGPYGLEVTYVDGESAIYTIDGAYWALYEGDQYAMQGVSTTPIVDGATYRYVYTEA